MSEFWFFNLESAKWFCARCGEPYRAAGHICDERVRAGFQRSRDPLYKALKEAKQIIDQALA